MGKAVSAAAQDLRKMEPCGNLGLCRSKTGIIRVVIISDFAYYKQMWREKNLFPPLYIWRFVAYLYSISSFTPVIFTRVCKTLPPTIKNTFAVQLSVQGRMLWTGFWASYLRVGTMSLLYLQEPKSRENTQLFWSQK